MNNLSRYQKQVREALKATGAYHKGLEMQIKALASALKTLDLASKEIDNLESVTVLQETRYGKKLAPHPAFKIQRDAQDSVTKQLKALNLTGQELEEATPLEKILREAIQ